MPSATIETFTRDLERLIKKFDADKTHYLSKSYNEAQARVDFISPFFKALGWDTENEEALQHHEREVIVERGERDTPGRPDYSFRVAGQTKFFVEAKAPSETIADPRHIFQAKSYVWSTKTVLFAILTDFEEFRFYASLKPDERKPDEGLLLNFRYTDYLAGAQKLWEFSRERIAAGSLEAWLPRVRRAERLSPPVDEAFLDEMTGWREELAKNIYKNNPALTARQLNEVVQRLLDRIVFIRIAEDRRVIDKMQLWEAAEKWRAHGGKFPIFEWLNDLFHRINEDFNGEIFKPHLSEEIKIDSEVLARIIERLYPPKSPYRFDVIGVELLGSIYERYLGKTIRVTPKQVRVEEKPEVRKAGGVYYTPKYIVDYIVKNTVGKLIEGKTPKQIEKIRILDPACGSGSFLIGAFQCLIDYHARYLSEHPKEAQAHALFPDITKDPSGEPRLSVIRKAEILKNNLFGVDIDPQAVEITMMSLYLKALEGERSQLPPKQHLLPELKNNIICGNSLIGPDFYKDQQLSFLDDEEKYRVHVFDWQVGFPEATMAGGFDCVIGNPPYVFARDEGFSAPEKRYFEEKYSHQNYQLNTFALFTEQGYSLMAKAGFFGFIIPNNWLSISTMKVFRDFLVSSTGNLCIVNNLFKVFHGANVDTSIVSFQKTRPNRVTLLEAANPATIAEVASVDPKILLTEPIIHIRKRRNEAAQGILAKMQKCSSILEGVALVKAGLKAYETGKGTPPQSDVMKKERIYHSDRRASKAHRQYLDGRDVKRYLVDWSGMYLKYGSNLAAPRNANLFEGERILVRQIPSPLPLAINGAIVSKEELNDINSMIVKSQGPYSNRYILGVINSRLLSFWFDLTFDKFQRAIFPQFKVNELAQFPIRTIDFSKREEKTQHDQMVALVERMLDLNKKKHSGKLAPSELDRLEREIAATDAEIDDLVYDLYAITPEERKIIESQQ